MRCGEGGGWVSRAKGGPSQRMYGGRQHRASAPPASLRAEVCGAATSSKMPSRLSRSGTQCGTHKEYGNGQSPNVVNSGAVAMVEQVGSSPEYHVSRVAGVARQVRVGGGVVWCCRVLRKSTAAAKAVTVNVGICCRRTTVLRTTCGGIVGIGE